MPFRRSRAWLSRCVSASCLALAWALNDPAANLDVASANSNIVVNTTSSNGFNGDAARFVRGGQGPGRLTYVVPAQIQAVNITFYATDSSFNDPGTWLMQLFLGDVRIGVVFSHRTIGTELASASSSAPTVRYL